MSLASEKQIEFILKLIETRDVESSYTSYIKDIIVNDPTKMTKALASSTITNLKAQPYKTTHEHTANTPAAAGYYTYENKVYKVQVSPNSGHAYAKVFDPDNGWIYITGMVYKLSNASPLTLDQAKEYGKLYGQCVICARTLTDENSIAAGIGPICAGKI